MALNAPSRLDSRLNSSSMTGWFREAGKNLLVGSLFVAGALWVLFNIPGIIPEGLRSSPAVAASIANVQGSSLAAMQHTLT